MKRLHDLRNNLPNNAKLNKFESLKIKGGEEENSFGSVECF